MSEMWIEPEGFPPLATGEVHVWLAHIPSAVPRLRELAALLSADERERVARFRFEPHRQRSQVARGVLRSLLGRYLDVDPQSFSFSYNAHGKPELKDTDLCFNTSHSGDYAAFALTRLGAVGVDIEEIRHNLDRSGAIAQRHFAPGEQQQFNAVPEGERINAFFQLWTRKEAFVKARGDGLFSGLDQFETMLNGAGLVSIRGAPAANWWVSSLPTVSGYAGAIVVNAAACITRFWRWE